MKLETFFKNFEVLAEAPNGVQKLRELILELAVRGKLVPQDPNDEPASVLLEKIKLEKERLINEGKIKEDHTTLLIPLDDISYTIPVSWKWCRWNDIALYIGDIDHKMPEEMKEGIPYVSPKDFTDNNGIDFERAKKISNNDFERLRKKIQPQKNDIIFPRYGTIGENRLVETDINFLASYSCAIIKNFNNFIEPKYSFYYSFSLLIKEEIKRYTNKTTQANVGVKSIKSFVFPLPPLFEQQRIVAKVDELMNLCDELETRQKKKQETRILINNAALNKLLTADTPEIFSKNWQRICDNFDIIYSVPENIGKLRQAILQLAVMGKLVPQDANDEPASVLLERIKVEKERLIKKGRIKEDHTNLLIPLDDISYTIPVSWKWCRWNDVALCIGDIDHKMPEEVKKGIPYVSPKDFTDNNGIDFERAKQISNNDFDRLRKKIQPQRNDIIFPRYGTIGENRLVETEIDFLASYSCAIIKNFNNFIEPKYSFYYSFSFLVKEEIKRYTNKTTQANVGVKSIKSFVFPLPPLSEQKRIVTKVDQLMKLCDQLETKLTQSQTESEKLIDAAVNQLLTL